MLQNVFIAKKMKMDYRNEVDISNFLFKHPFTCCIAGATSSGKTVLVRRILKHYQLLTDIESSTLEVVYCYGQYQSIFEEKVSNNVNVAYNDGLITEDELKERKPQIVIIDDLMNELASDIKLANLFTKGSHHNNISVIFITQNLFAQGKQMRTVSVNSHYYLIMKNPRDKMQIKRFAIQAYPNTSHLFMQAYEDATSKQYGYIKVDFSQTTLDKFRLTTRITPEEVSHLTLDFSPIVYCIEDG